MNAKTWLTLDPFPFVCVRLFVPQGFNDVACFTRVRRFRNRLWLGDTFATYGVKNRRGAAVYFDEVSEKIAQNCAEHIQHRRGSHFNIDAFDST